MENLVRLVHKPDGDAAHLALTHSENERPDRAIHCLTSLWVYALDEQIRYMYFCCTIHE